MTASIQIRLPCATAEDVKERLGAELAEGAVFVRTKTPKAVRTLIRFDFRYATGTTVLKGIADVVEVSTDEARPGMRLKIVALDRDSHAVLQRLGLPLSVPVLKTPTQAPARAPIGSRPPPPRPPEPVKPPAPEPPAPVLPTSPLEPEPNDPFALIDAPPARPSPPSEPPRPPPQISTEPQSALAESVEPFLPADQRAPIPRTGPVVGIDLGTSNSCVAWTRNGKLEVIPSREGWNTVPSVVAVNSRGKTLVGHPAKGQLLTNPEQTVFGAKRLIGRPFHSQAVVELRERFPYDIVEGPKGEAAVKLAGRIYTLQEISALVLREVRSVAQATLEQDVTRAVITVPAFYNELQRQAVRDAGELAGIHVEKIVSEPTAAALAFAHGRQLEERVLVYDLGGGTFDVSVLELRGNVYEVISTGGDTFLGGVDFDVRLLEIMLAKFEETNGVPFDGDRVALQRLLDAAERAKMALSQTATERVNVPFITLHDDRPLSLDCTVTREELEQATTHLVERTLQVTGEVLAACGLKPTDIAEIILVGGQSRSPLVRSRLRDYFGKEPTKSVHPDEAIALGAAALARTIEHEDAGSVVLVDVLPMSLGIGLGGGRFKKLVERNVRLPHTVTHTVSTTKDNQTELELVIFQGENDRAVDNDYLGSVIIDKLPKAPKGAVKLDITFRVTQEAILSITTRETTEGRETQHELATRDTPDELRRKLADRAPPPPPKGVRGFFKRLFGSAA